MESYVNAFLLHNTGIHIYFFFIAASVQSETLILEHNSLQILHMPHKTNMGWNKDKNKHGKPWQGKVSCLTLLQRTWTGILRPCMFFRPSSVSNNSLWISLKSPESSWTALLAMLVMFVPVLCNDNSIWGKAFRILFLFLCAPLPRNRCFWFLRHSGRGSTHTQQRHIIGGWCKGARAEHVS